TQVPQPSDSTEYVTDEAVYKELDDRLVRAATITSSLEAEQDNDNIDKTQSKATPNKASSSGTTSGGGLKCQETMVDTLAQTMFENVKITQALEITSLKMRVKKLEKKQRSRTYKLKRLYKVGLTAREDSPEDEHNLEVVEDINTAKLIVDVAQANTAGEVNDASITTTDSAAATITTEEVTLAKALVELKASKHKPKKKDQIRLDEEATLKLQAELQAKFKEEKDLKEKKAQKELEANIALIET
nr:hypothetical protein [Tanacetum cinerariifolium]